MTIPPSQPHDAPPSTTRTVHAGDVFSFLRRGAPLALFVALLAAAVAFLAARNADPVYRATTSLLASEPALGEATVDVVAAPRVDPDVYREALLEGPVIAEALARVNGTPPGEQELERFLERVSVEVANQEVSSVVRIGVEDTDPAQAAVFANTIAEELVSWDRARAREGFTRSVEAIENEIAAIDRELERGDLTEGRRTALLALRNQRVQEIGMAQTGNEQLVVMSRLAPLRVAMPPEAPVRPRLVFDTFVAFVVGLAAAYALLFVRASLDRRIRDRRELQAVSGLPVLAEFPRRSRSTRDLATESAAFFHTQLLLRVPQGEPLVLAITSPSGPEEKDGVAVALAESFARGGHRTLLIDGDLRRPGSTEGLDVRTKQSAPFEVHLENPDRRYAPATVAIGGRGTFDFIPSFTASAYPAELLNKGLAAGLERWREEYDVIVIDSTAVLPFADTLAIAPQCTGLVLCTSLGASTRDEVEESLALLRRADVEVLGTVLTSVPPRRRTTRSAAAPAAIGTGDAKPESYRTLGRPADGRRAGTAEQR